tara:strand:+ start:305 stop:994 length:690 start_codon:yes stop_codon:yes gene_type:complete
MANWKELLKEGDVESTLDGLSSGIFSVADGDKLIAFDAGSSNELKKMTLPPEYFSMNFGFRYNISDSGGGRYLYFPYDAWGSNFYGRYDSTDISTNGTPPSSIGVKSLTDTSAPHRPNNAMGYMVPAGCTAFIGCGTNNIYSQYTTTANISLLFYVGTPSTLSTTTYNLMHEVEFTHNGQGNFNTGTVVFNDSVSINQSIIPAIMSKASTGTGNRRGSGNFNLLFKLTV